VRKLLVTLMFALLVAPRSGEAGWGPFRLFVAGEAGSLLFDELAEFTGYVEGASGQPDRAESLRYDLADASAFGFSAGLELGPDVRLSWSRQEARSHLEAFLDGREIQDDPAADPRIDIPRVDLRIDLIALTYRPQRLAWGGVGPYVRVGYGWFLMSQRRPFRPTPSRLPRNFSDSDGTTEATVGAEARWRFLRAGAELRTLHWQWDPEDDKVPGRTTHAVSPVYWLGISL